MEKQIYFGSKDEVKENIQLGKISQKVNTKNVDNICLPVLTNSATSGVIYQNDYFDNAKITTVTNLSGYTIISQNDYVYNPRKSTKAPYGPINRSKIEGQISPLYTCFSIVSRNINLTYLDYYFKSTLWYKFIYTYGDTGTRHDRVSITNDTFYKIPIQLPNQEIQKSIGNHLSQIDKLIDTKEKERELYAKNYSG